MADVYSGTSNVSVNVSGQYKQAFLAFLTPEFYYTGFGKKGGDMNLSLNSGTTVTWDKPALLPVATTAIPEYETPQPLSYFSTTAVTATIAWYGDHIMHSDRMVLVALNKGILAKMREVQVQQYRNTMDQLCRDVLVAGDNVVYANGTGRTDVDKAGIMSTALGLAALYGAVNDLRRTDVPFITRRVNPSQLVGTVGLEESYIALGHVDLDYDIRQMTGFKSVVEYAQPGTAQPGEIGKVGQVRFILSSNGKIWASGGHTDITTPSTRSTNSTNADVYGIVVLGADAYGEVLLGGKGFEYIVHAPGSSGSTDPHNQRGSAAWHQAAVYKILDQSRLTRIECACTSV